MRGFNLIVRTLVDLDTPAPQLRAALVEATHRERATATRLIRLKRGAATAESDQIESELRELERRHPGVGDEAA